MLGFRGCRLGIGYPGNLGDAGARRVRSRRASVQKEGIKVQPEIMIPLVGFKKELDLQVEVVHQAAPRGAGRAEGEAELHGRHDDRDAARRADRRRDRAVGRVLQLRHQRPDADWRSACRATTRARSCRRIRSSRSSRRTRSRRSTRPASASWSRSRSKKGRADAARHQARDLRRARRRSGVDPVLREGRPRLRELLAVPRARSRAWRRRRRRCQVKVGD